MFIAPVPRSSEYRGGLRHCVGDTSKHLPFTCASGGSQTTHAMTRASYAVANECKQKLKEIAAKTHGGKPEEYEVANQRVFRKGGGAVLALPSGTASHSTRGIYDATTQLPMSTK